MSMRSFSVKRWYGCAALLLLGTSTITAGCSSDDPPSKNPGSAGQGSGGDPDEERPPKPGQAGEPTQEGPVDSAPPTFTGLREATAVGETRIRLSWDAASDDLTPSDSISYAVYESTSTGKQDFSQPLTVAPAGAEGVLISGLTPSTEYFFVVRAIDQAGNEDDNASEGNAATADMSPPAFAGIGKLTATTSRSVRLEWKAAHDKGAASSEISYNVYLAAESGKQNFKKPTATSKAGEISTTVAKLQPLTDYFAVVRAIDADGNEDDNSYELSVHTPEGVSPVFNGAKRALSESGGVRVYWPPATDNVTETANIVYDVFVATESGKFDFSKPSYTSPPAAVSYLVEGLTAGTRYYFVVRARDVGGNNDNNTIEVNARPVAASDKSAPVFAGVTSATGTSPSTLVANWSPATDDVTPASAMVYEVYISDTSGGQNFNSPRLVTSPGATSATLTGLPPGAARYFVVRARDEAGNVASNRKEAKATTLARPDSDTAPPVWKTGPSLATVDSLPYELDVSWTAATDDHVAADIRYHLCAETLESNCVGLAFNEHVRATSDWGAITAKLTKLRSRTTYFVYVRAEDRSGNVEVGDHGASITTLTSWATDVAPILANNCLSCHNFSVLGMVRVSGGFFDPEAAKVSARYAEGLPLVDPGFPEYSLLYRRINPLGLQAKPFSAAAPNTYSGPQEPRDGSNQYVFPLTGAEDGAIRDWIKQGAFATE